MDIKVEGITPPILAAALAQAKAGRAHILGEMMRCSPPPRRALSAHAPAVVAGRIDPSRNGAVIGGGGRTIKAICEATGADNIGLDDAGRVEITAPTAAAAQAALEFVMLLAEDPAPGAIFRGRKVASVLAFGAFVELAPGKQGLVHISELDAAPVADATRFCKARPPAPARAREKEQTPRGQLRPLLPPAPLLPAPPLFCPPFSCPPKP